MKLRKKLKRITNGKILYLKNIMIFLMFSRKKAQIVFLYIKNIISRFLLKNYQNMIAHQFI